MPEESTLQSLKVDLDAAPAVRQLNQGYTGWGGIPGYIMVNFWPDDQNLPKLGPCVAHEFNHQIRLTVEPWQMEISVAEYIVMEGLGENLAEARRMVGRALEVRGFHEVRRYIFGDQVMAGFGCGADGRAHPRGICHRVSSGPGLPRQDREDSRRGDTGTVR